MLRSFPILYENEKVVICDEKLYGYRKRAGSIMNQNSTPRLDCLEALKGAAAYFEEKNDEELAEAARRRYVLNIQLAYFRTYVSTKNLQTLKALKKERSEYCREYKNKFGKFNFIEKAQFFVFNWSSHLYVLMCSVLSIFKH